MRGIQPLLFALLASLAAVLPLHADRSRDRQKFRRAIGSLGDARDGLHQRAGGHAGWTRDFKARRQRGGCSDRRERDARFDGASLEWSWRRFVRNRLQRKRKQTLRNQRERPFPAWTELRPDENGTGEAASRDD